MKQSISPAAAKRMLEARRKAATVPLLSPSFPQQNAFIEDPGKLKALFCTRRAAKSYTGCLYMVQECLRNPGANCLFIGLTRDSAREIAWKDILKVIDRQHGLGCIFNESLLTMTFPNRAVIRLTGVDADENEMNKLLGKKYRLCILDEASMYSIDLRNLIYGVLKPAVADQRGTICMLGTASNFPRGLFYDITTRKEGGWSLHTWTAFDNPFVKDNWALEIKDIEANRPLFMQTTLYKQWYLNEWVIDNEKLVYKYSGELNSGTRPQHLPPAGWTYVLGVDLGWEDDTAFVLIAFHEHDGRLYVVKTYNRKHMTFDQVISKIQEFMMDPMMPAAKVIVDGAAKQGIESMKLRSAIPFEYADKLGKVDFIELLNADFVQGLIKIDPASKTLINELQSLLWKTDGERIIVPKKEHPGLPNHLCDAFLYAWRNGYHYAHSTPAKITAKGSKEWYEKQAEDIWERERERLEQQEEAAKGGWPSNGTDWGKF
jgi:phage terminase large subunit